MENHEADSGTELCACCSREFTQDNLVFLENNWICGECKPSFVQMMEEGVAPTSMTVARKKKILVMGKNVPLPDRCVKCNAPANMKRLTKRLYWHSPVVYAALLLNVLIYALIAMCVRKKATVEVGLCDRHFAKRKTAILVSWLLVLVSAGLLVGGLTADIVPLIIAAPVLFLGTIIYAAIATSIVSPRKIDKEHVWLRGVCKDYLDELPEWEGA